MIPSRPVVTLERCTLTTARTTMNMKARSTTTMDMIVVIGTEPPGRGESKRIMDPNTKAAMPPMVRSP